MLHVCLSASPPSLLLSRATLYVPVIFDLIVTVYPQRGRSVFSCGYGLSAKEKGRREEAGRLEKSPARASSAFQVSRTSSHPSSPTGPASITSKVSLSPLCPMPLCLSTLSKRLCHAALALRLRLRACLLIAVRPARPTTSTRPHVLHHSLPIASRPRTVLARRLCLSDTRLPDVPFAWSLPCAHRHPLYPADGSTNHYAAIR